MAVVDPIERRARAMAVAAGLAWAVAVVAAWAAGGPARTVRAVLAAAAGLVAAAAAVAWRSSRQAARLRRSNAELGALADMAHRMASSRRPVELAGLLLEGVAEGFGRPRAAAVVCDAPAGTADAFVLDGAGGLVHVGTGPADEAASPLDPLVTVAHALDAGRDALLARALPGASNVLVVPLVAHGEAHGTLAVELGTAVAQEAVAGLERFALHAAVVLRAASLQTEVERLAGTDALTGLGNRRAFQDALVRELALARRRGEPCGLILFDVDRFKAVNDRLGHQAGDEVLRRVAATLARAARTSDLAARFGGEEFAVILPNCTPTRAVRVAERLREAVAADADPTRVTLSAGVAAFPGDGQNEEAVIAAADAALYRAKASGRDRTVRFDGPPDLADRLAG